MAISGNLVITALADEEFASIGVQNVEWVHLASVARTAEAVLGTINEFCA
jgi:hypothetical protein